MDIKRYYNYKLSCSLFWRKKEINNNLQIINN